MHLHSAVVGKLRALLGAAKDEVVAELVPMP